MSRFTIIDATSHNISDEDILERIATKTGEPVNLDDFSWNPETCVLTSEKPGLIFNFPDVSRMTFITADDCFFHTASDCFFHTGDNCIIESSSCCEFTLGSNCKVKCNVGCTIKAGDNCKFVTCVKCNFKTGNNCVFNTGNNCTFETGNNCVFRTGGECTFNTKDNCTFISEGDSTFEVGSSCFISCPDVECCSIKCGDDCLVSTGRSTVSAGNNCKIDNYGGKIVLNQGNFIWSYTDDITIKSNPDKPLANFLISCDYQITAEGKNNLLVHPIISGGQVQIKPVKLDDCEVLSCPTIIDNCLVSNRGYLIRKLDSEYFTMEDSSGNTVNYVYFDNIISRVLKRKGNVFKVINLRADKESYIIKSGVVYSHGETLREAKDNLLYKLSHRDTSYYNNYTLDTVVTKQEAIQMYRVITGACEYGTKEFCRHRNLPEKATVAEVIEITKGQYNWSAFRDFFKRKH